MTTPSDATLLNAFVRDRDEAAFRVLVERHLSLIFHAALRKTGSRVMAEEVSQNVLCAVASKASSLAVNPERFVPWLHRATLYESTKAMRSESSQSRRKDLLHPDDLRPSEGAGEELWAKALPHLDGALDRLAEKDRRVLMLHFFEKLPFSRIGGLLGKSPAAVQKQSVRALEKLSQILRGRGVVVPVGVLASGMLAESAKGAPMHLAGALTAKALGAAAAPSLSSGVFLMITGKSKILVPCGLLLLGLPLAMQQLSIAGAERELAGLRQGPRPAATAKREVRESPGLVKISTSLDLVRLADEAGETRRSEGLKFALKRKLGALSAEELEELLDGARKVRTGIMKRLYLAEFLAYALAAKDPARVMACAERGWMTQAWAPELLGRWAQVDPGAAREWLAKMEAMPEYRSATIKEEAGAGEGRGGWRRGTAESLNGVDSEQLRREKIAWTEGDSLRQAYGNGPLKTFQQALFVQLMRMDAEQAIGYLESFPPDTRQMTLISDGFHYLDPASSANEAAGWLKATRMLPEASRKVMLTDFAIHAMGSNLDALDLSKVEPFLQAVSALPEERWFLAEGAAKRMLRHDLSPGTQAEVAAWLEEVVPAEAGPIREDALALVHAEQRQSALAMLRHFEKERATPEDRDIIHNLSNQYFRGDLTEPALKLADKIVDPALREEMKQKILERAR
ncbi:RNA polymerase sigma factor [Luteolibacter luteus]|uniref:Sigma-70 family RNA polymerase sigma factor n=1 Tax=Luteolibacter luteus TaxID=2728835 RepID=A0A858RML7_9BACT|nr:sigma-70 family RNA polymerase sigma factor [Luteolibacter luteus]QJE98237.1 sigma-70 family RNA polymerase sigma factor [Luteolibacter luteus]